MTTIINKMAIAKTVYAELMAEGYKLPEGFKSPRGVFIKRMCDEHGMTPQGAGTYYHNLNNLARGKSLYHKPKKVAAAPEVTQVAEEPAVEKPATKKAAAKK